MATTKSTGCQQVVGDIPTFDHECLSLSVCQSQTRFILNSFFSEIKIINHLLIVLPDFTKLDEKYT